jgi:hypothetical protein
MSSMNKTLTVRFTVSAQEAVDAIFNDVIPHAKMGATAWGDLFAERNHYKQRYEYAKKLLKRCHFGELDLLDRMEKMDKKKLREMRK